MASRGIFFTLSFAYQATQQFHIVTGAILLDDGFVEELFSNDSAQCTIN